MSEQRPTIKFLTNVPQEVIFKFDTPKSGINQHGTWYLYGVDTPNFGEAAFFASENLNLMINALGLGRGDKAVILKKEELGADGKIITRFTVNGKTLDEIKNSNPVAFQKNVAPPPAFDGQPATPQHPAVNEYATINAKLDVIIKKLALITGDGLEEKPTDDVVMPPKTEGKPEQVEGLPF